MTCAGLNLVAADPPKRPDAIVIRPQKPGSVSDPIPTTKQAVLRGPAVAHTDPKRPGFLIIKPQPADGSVPEQQPGKSILTQTGPAGNKGSVATNQPAPRPSPVGEANQPQEADNKEDGKLILETWDAVFIRNMHVGYFHIVVREYEREGKTYRYGVKTQRLWLARFGQKVEQWGEDSSMEDAEGKVLANRVRQGLGKEQQLVLDGRVDGNKLKLKVEGTIEDEKEVPWPDGVLGVAKEATLFQDKKPKPGDVFEYLAYEGRVGRVVKFQVEAKGYEEGPLFVGGPSRKMLKSEVKMEPIGDFRLPPALVWCDAETYEVLRLETDVTSLGGRMIVLRTDKTMATRPVGQVPDLFEVQSIRLNRGIPNVHEQQEVVYKITAPQEVPVDRVFPENDRQRLENLDKEAKTVELTAKAHPPAAAMKDIEPGKEYLSSNFFIDWDDDRVKQLAQTAIRNLPGNSQDLQKAQAVAVWVNRNMKSADFSQAMASCSAVAKNLSGDCTEYSMLAAGMCRALGIPSRTALGVIYAEDRERKPFLAYHMWFEVYDGQRWVGLDATLPEVKVGPGHLKITDAHWHDEKSFAPLLPVLAVLLAGPTVEVLRVSPGR